MAISIDFTGVADSQSVDVGEYEAAVFDIQLKDGAKGQYLAWQFKIQGGKFDGRAVFDNTSLVPAALFRLKAHLKALLPTADMSGALNFDPADLVGKRCIIVVKHEEYNGEQRARIARLKPLEGSIGLSGDVVASNPGDSDLPF